VAEEITLHDSKRARALTPSPCRTACAWEWWPAPACPGGVGASEVNPR